MKWGTQEQKDKWLPLIAAGEKIAAFALSEPDVGTDAKGVKTLYQKVSDGYLINGRKKWISFGEIADVFIIVASDSRQCTAFILERNLGVRSQPIHGMLGCRAAHVAELDLENIIIPPNCVLGQEGSGFPFIVGTALDHGRYSIAWAGVAIAQESLEAMLAYARKRKQFGQKIHDFQLVRGLIGDAVTGTHAARALALRAGELRKIGDPQAFAETTIAKYFSSKVAMKVAADAVQVHGGNGCCNAYPVERLFREAKILEIIEGTSQIQQDIIAKHAIRRGS